MSDQWRQEKRGDFGWSVEVAHEIKAFWLGKAEFADPGAKASGTIGESTAKLLERKVAEHAGEITPHPNLLRALRSRSLTAFAMADSLGGGYLIVFPAGLMNYQTIATEGHTPARDATTQRSATSAESPSPELTSRLSGFRSRLARLFSFGPAAKLASALASDDDATFVSALTEAVQYAPQGNDLGIRAMEEAMRRRAGRRGLEFLQPSLGSLTGRFYGELQDAPKRLLQLAEAGALLRDPHVSQDLLAACLTGHGADGIRDCILKAADLGGAGQCYAFQLLYNHLLQTAGLAHARGARSWTEQMTDASGSEPPQSQTPDDNFVLELSCTLTPAGLDRWKALLNMKLGDRAGAARLVMLEKKRHPNESIESLVQLAIDSLAEDIRRRH